VTCCWCGGYVPMPERRGEETFCVECGKGFQEACDLGWWSYSCEIYLPV
jgi:hypothetical protein